MIEERSMQSYSERVVKAHARANVRVMTSLILVTLIVLGAAVIAHAQTGRPRGAAAPAAGAPEVSGTGAAEVIDIRQQAFKKMGGAFKLIHNELANASPDAAKIAAAAAQIKASSQGITTWFPPGSGPQTGLKTHAKAEIWTDASGFAATRAAFLRQVEKSARQLSDPRERAAWKDSGAALGQACKDCHDSYRVKG